MACNELGATVQAVDTMTLEEIFVANVHRRRTQEGETPDGRTTRARFRTEGKR